MTDAKKPMAEANRISSMLNTVIGADRFPVLPCCEVLSLQAVADSEVVKKAVAHLEWELAKAQQTIKILKSYLPAWASPHH